MDFISRHTVQPMFVDSCCFIRQTDTLFTIYDLIINGAENNIII